MSNESLVRPTKLQPTMPDPSKRLLSPMAMLLALAMFPLPWISLSCGEHPPGQARKVQFTATQSGFQATYGGATYHEGTMTKGEARARVGLRPKSGGAPLLVIYAILLTVGMVASLQMAPGDARLQTLFACSAGALAMLLIQIALGLPLVPKNANTSPTGRNHAFVDVDYTIWFWLALVGTITAAILAGFEWHRDARRPWTIISDEDEAMAPRTTAPPS